MPYTHILEVRLSRANRQPRHDASDTYNNRSHKLISLDDLAGYGGEVGQIQTLSPPGFCTPPQGLMTQKL